MKKFLLCSIVSLCVGFAMDAQNPLIMNITSSADDEYAHPYDNPGTPQDETIDGVCGDINGRCTFRAALEETLGLGFPLGAFIDFTDTLVIDPEQGTFYLLDHSFIAGAAQEATFSATSSIPLFAIENDVLIKGIKLSNALAGIEVYGKHNTIGGTSDHERVIISDMVLAGIILAGDSNKVLGNFIFNNGQNGIIITGRENKVRGNVIGLDPNIIDGSPFGIFITGGNNTIGGLNAGEGNVISGNDIGIGVYALGDSTFIFGNRIGTDIYGLISLGNRVGIQANSPNVLIGKHPDGANLISGNTESGVLIGLDGQNIVIRNNSFGTDRFGLTHVPNRDGITLGPGTMNTLVQDNIIKGNSNNGILISGLNFAGLQNEDNKIRGNIIQQNGNAGIMLTGNANDNIIGSSRTVEYPANQIKNNGQAGVMFVAVNGDPQRNTIRKNSLQDNSGFGIRILAGQGAIQPPALESYTDDGQGTAIILGTHSLAGAIIDIYAGDANQSIRQEGVLWLGSGTVDASGYFSIQISSCPCDYIVATATDVIGNTSEFSEGWETVTSLGDQPGFIFSTKAYPNPFNENVHITFELKQPGEVSLEIYDLDGCIIETLIHSTLYQGEHSASWNPDLIPCGIYYYRLTVGNQSAATGKMIYLK